MLLTFLETLFSRHLNKQFTRRLIYFLPHPTRPGTAGDRQPHRQPDQRPHGRDGPPARDRPARRTDQPNPEGTLQQYEPARVDEFFQQQVRHVDRRHVHAEVIFMNLL